MNDMDYSLGRPRQRRPNYTKRELETLIEKLEEKPQMYLGLTTEEYRGYTPEEVIRKGWDEVAQAVNAVGGYDRSGRELRAKWRDMKAKVKYKAQDACAQPMSDIEQKIMDMLSRLALDLPEESKGEGVAPVIVQNSPVSSLVSVVSPNQLAGSSDEAACNSQQNAIHITSNGEQVMPVSPQERPRRRDSWIQKYLQMASQNVDGSAFEQHQSLPWFSQEMSASGSHREKIWAQCFSNKDHLQKDILELLQAIAMDQAEIKESVASIQTAVNEHAAVAKQRLALEQRRMELEEKKLEVEERRVAAEEKLLTLLVQGKIKIVSS